MNGTLRLGTRGSPLARHQTDMTAEAIRRASPEHRDDGSIETVVIRTTGDRVTDRPLAEIGGKGLFCKEIENALLEGEIDVAVHSMKDLPTWLPDGLILAAVLERADPRDVLISRDDRRLADLPEGALLGTTSPRRQAQIMARRPDLRVAMLRGNVQTRLDRIRDGLFDATLLARAGLDRLGIGAVGVTLGPDEMLPACGQGIVALECRADDESTRALLRRIDHAPTAVRARAERGVLEAIDGSCHTPAGAFAEATDEGLRIRGLLAWPDGSRAVTAERSGAPADAARLGRDLGDELRSRAGPDYPAYG